MPGGKALRSERPACAHVCRPRLPARMNDEEFYRVLADVTAAVTESLVLETALDRLGGVVVPRLADWCAIHLLEDDGIRLAILTHPDAAQAAAARALDARYGPVV